MATCLSNSIEFLLASLPNPTPRNSPKRSPSPRMSLRRPSASVLGDRALLKEATTRITHDGGENPLMIGISPLPSFPPSLPLLPSLPLPSKRKWRQLLLLLGGGGGEEVFQDCVILIDFGGGEKKRSKRKRGEETNPSSESTAKLRTCKQAKHPRVQRFSRLGEFSSEFMSV